MSKRRSKRKKPLTPARARVAGNGLGRGHGNTTGAMPPIEPMLNATIALHNSGGVQPGTVAYQMGDCAIFVSPPTNGVGWHMSVSRQDRLPTWDEIAHARYTLVPDEVTMAAILPPKGEYINVHNFCMQVIQIRGVAR
jgi:hypothetical protein